MVQTIYLVSSEAKDEHCLAPLVGNALSSVGSTIFVNLQQAFKSKSGIEALRGLASDPYPCVIGASPAAINFVKSLRGDNSFLAIGTEHGFAPFKKHTFSRRLLTVYDFYLAPTKLWAERLTHLYPELSAKVKIGGYPRAADLAEILHVNARVTIDSESFPYWHGVAPGSKKLVIFSWGTDPEAISLLPDEPEIVYLFHPASAKRAADVKLSRAHVVISKPITTARLLANADIIFGDFSSMTLEAANLGLPTHLFICRKLYSSSCDMDEEFFDRQSDRFAIIPHSSYQFDRTSILDFDQLMSALTGKDSSSLNAQNFPPEVFPPQGDGRLSVISAVAEILGADVPAPSMLRHDTRRFDFIVSAYDAYEKALGRAPDTGGLQHYLEKFLTSKDCVAVASLKLFATLLQSKEAKLRRPNLDDLRVDVQLQ